MNHEDFVKKIAEELDDGENSIIKIIGMKNVPTVFVSPETFIDCMDTNSIYLNLTEKEYAYYTEVNDSTTLMYCTKFPNINEQRMKKLEKAKQKVEEKDAIEAIEYVKETHKTAQQSINEILGIKN